MDPTNTDNGIKVCLEIMPFGKGGEEKAEVNQKRFLQTSRLQGKFFH